MSQLYVGCSGFYYREWKGYFYPETLPTKDWFEYYTQHFNTVEINASFYRLPRLSMLRRWHETSPVDFRFTIKVPRTITHFSKFQNTAEELKSFYELAQAGLGEKLGPVLFQLPPSLQFSSKLLAIITAQLDKSFMNVIEFRHKSWWCTEVYEKLHQANVTFCSISFPGLPEEVINTSTTLYVRFHGVPKLYYSQYSVEELESWANKVKQTGAKNVFAYFNNTASLEAIGNARYFGKLLS